MTRWIAALAWVATSCATPANPPPSGGGAAPATKAPPRPVAPAPDAAAETPPPPTPAQLAREILILDGHVDVPWRLEKSRNPDGTLSEDIASATAEGDFDYPRAKAGGLDAPFMSIYVSPEFEKRGAKKVADGLIDMVEEVVKAAPEKFALAGSVAQVRENFAAGKISLPLGMENGAPIEGKLANVAYFHGRGIRYITLAHSKDNHIADSSYDTRHTHHGLSKFGESVVREMNRVGIMVDVSHVSDDAFEDVMRVTKTPVIASHSSCRHFTPGWERNMSDAMIEQLAANGGVIQINFGSAFLDGAVQDADKAYEKALAEHLSHAKLAPDSEAGKEAGRVYHEQHPTPRASVKDVADHIDHVVKLVGVEHVGLGSDFDGVGDSLPEGLRDASQYPNLIAELVARGYDRAKLEAICSGNVLRVWQAVEDYAKGQAR